MKQSNIHGSLDPARLAGFEARVGTTLPADYRRFLQTDNRAILDPETIVLPGEAEPFASVNEIFGLDAGPYPLDEVYENLLDQIPPELLGFAEVEGGDLLCLEIRGEHYGQVYYWDHERSSPGADEPTWENIRRLADSFDAFLAALGGAQPG